MDRGYTLVSGAILVFLLAAGALYWTGLTSMVGTWASRAEYSYGYIVPLVSAFLFYRRLPDALEAPNVGHYLGPLIAIVAVALGLLGNVSQINDVTQYGLIVSLVALLVSHVGIRVTLMLWASIIHLVFMIPLPQVIFLKLTASLQLWSSELGVFLIQLIDIPVFLDGNIIDLGVYKLQVAEACSGLRYMFPLMSFGFLFSAIYQGPNIQRFLLFLSTVPITIFMNGLRIGVIGILVNYYGIGHAEGFLHLFEGWVIFGGCVAILFLECLAFLYLRRSPVGLGEALDLHLGTLEPVRRFLQRRGPIGAVPATLVLLSIAGATMALNLFDRPPLHVPRQSFITFPLSVDGWKGEPQTLEAEIRQVLGADDYHVADYAKSNVAAPVNLFMSYYEDQTTGRAVHSPEVCIPGDGWEIRNLDSVFVDLGENRKQPLRLARAVIQKGLDEALVYFWFEQRGRQLDSEYLTKWYILWDGLTIRRTDGGLVRLVTPILGNEDGADADARLQRFLRTIYPLIERHIPNAPDPV